MVSCPRPDQKSSQEGPLGLCVPQSSDSYEQPGHPVLVGAGLTTPDGRLGGGCTKRLPGVFKSKPTEEQSKGTLQALSLPLLPLFPWNDLLLGASASPS